MAENRENSEQNQSNNAQMNDNQQQIVNDKYLKRFQAYINNYMSSQQMKTSKKVPPEIVTIQLSSDESQNLSQQKGQKQHNPSSSSSSSNSNSSNSSNQNDKDDRKKKKSQKNKQDKEKTTVQNKKKQQQSKSRSALKKINTKNSPTQNKKGFGQTNFSVNSDQLALNGQHYNDFGNRLVTPANFISKQQFEYVQVRKKARQLASNSITGRRNKLQYQAFINRRIPKSDNRLDLGVFNLEELVTFAHNEEIISKQLYYQFNFNYSQKKQIEFVKYFVKEDLQSWDFKSNKITIADHRRLASLLLKVKPQVYILEKPESLDIQLNQFLQSIYQLEEQKYQKMMEFIDQISKNIWWKPLQIRYLTSKQPQRTKISLKDDSILLSAKAKSQKQSAAKIFYKKGFQKDEKQRQNAQDQRITKDNFSQKKPVKRVRFLDYKSSDQQELQPQVKSKAKPEKFIKKTQKRTQYNRVKRNYPKIQSNYQRKILQRKGKLKPQQQQVTFEQSESPSQDSQTYQPRSILKQPKSK